MVDFLTMYPHARRRVVRRIAPRVRAAWTLDEIYALEDR